MIETILPALIPIGASLIINVITICALVVVRKKAKTEAEKSELDAIITNVITNGVTSIKNICDAQGITLNKKEVKKIASKTIKEELKKETTTNEISAN